ncbi:hypothetical protein FB45DRAFT_872532 [Roridomyces roridus]|uniref:Uncharacterized protein n=1 Tax=Roridomyces roridus TaxID=1738132 RepID=A0AAD7BCL6_9AGAR|nr:hypothetical protein FB45DRAFT_872532 [Roridomyces roridus]
MKIPKTSWPASQQPGATSGHKNRPIQPPESQKRAGSVGGPTPQPYVKPKCLLRHCSCSKIPIPSRVLCTTEHQWQARELLVCLTSVLCDPDQMLIKQATWELCVEKIRTIYRNEWNSTRFSSPTYRRQNNEGPAEPEHYTPHIIPSLIRSLMWHLGIESSVMLFRLILVHEGDPTLEVSEGQEFI